MLKFDLAIYHTCSCMGSSGIKLRLRRGKGRDRCVHGASLRYDNKQRIQKASPPIIPILPGTVPVIYIEP